MLALLVNNQWPAGQANSERCEVPAFHAKIQLVGRLRLIEGSRGQGKENHVWLVWDYSRRPGTPLYLIAKKKPVSEPARRICIVCRAPLPPGARANAEACSATCRQRKRRLGMAQRRTA
jgi:hypothetical protein